jgi:16S rRNA (cytidine1402-2'-O)-methyltransferase
MGILSVVGTPIGNLEDITLRAIRVLKEADYILCEDTRVTGKLLKQYEIATKMRRYDAHASDAMHMGIIADLQAGKKIALVSDAGTPGISDPGVMLVTHVREANVGTIEVIPGPSALTAAFSIAGISGNNFVFLGFIPQKKGRQTFFKRLPEYDMPVMFYEAPHRIMKTLESLCVHLTPEYTVVVARELTKMFEEVVTGNPEEVFQYLTDRPDHVRGEFVVIISGNV